MAFKIYFTLLFLVLPLIFLPAASPAGSEDLNITGWWSARVLADLIEFEVEQNGERLDGVAYLISPMGSKNIYHWAGLLRGRDIIGLHHSGHQFKGQLNDQDRIIGVLTTSKGIKIPVAANRMKSPDAKTGRAGLD
ncbi:MAG: hypothetical protein V1816_23240 [Pseudomonadota bacterium]